MPSEIHHLYYTWKQMHNHTVKREFVTYDRVRYIEHIAQDLVLYIGHKSSQLAEGKCHTHTPYTSTGQTRSLKSHLQTDVFGPERSPKM